MEVCDIQSIWNEIKGEVVKFYYKKDGQINRYTMLPKQIGKLNGRTVIWAFVDSLTKGESCTFEPIFVYDIRGFEDYDFYVYKSTNRHFRLKYIGRCDFNKNLREFRILRIYKQKYNHKVGEIYRCPIPFANLKEISII